MTTDLPNQQDYFSCVAKMLTPLIYIYLIYIYIYITQGELQNEKGNQTLIFSKGNKIKPREQTP